MSDCDYALLRTTPVRASPDIDLVRVQVGGNRNGDHSATSGAAHSDVVRAARLVGLVAVRHREWLRTVRAGVVVFAPRSHRQRGTAHLVARLLIAWIAREANRELAARVFLENLQ